MILNTRFRVTPDFDRRTFYGMLSTWVSTSKLYTGITLEEDFNFEDKNYEFQADTENETAKVKVIISNYETRFAFKSVSEQGNSTFTTIFVLDDVSEHPSLHVSTNVTYSVAVESDKKFTPYPPHILKSIFWDEYGDFDENILTSKDPQLVRKSDVEWLVKMFSGEIKYLNPIVYASADNVTGKPLIDATVAADALMGQAHVLVSSSPFVSDVIQDNVESYVTVPYNGAVGVVYPGGLCKLFIKRKTEPNDKFTSRIVSEVQDSMANMSIDEDFDYTRLAQKHLFSRLEGQTDSEFVDLCQQMLDEKDTEIVTLKQEISELKTSLRNMESKAFALQSNFDSKKSDDNGLNSCMLRFEGSEVYNDEIAAVILKVLRKEYESMKDDNTLSSSRKFDVIGDVLEHNFPCDTDARLISSIKSAFDDGAITREGIGHLRSDGFIVEKTGSDHYRIYVDGFEKYSMTVANTPSDKASSVKNTISDFCKLLFGC